MTSAHRTHTSAHSSAHTPDEHDAPHVLSLAEAAEHLGVTRNALRMRVARGSVPSLRVGRRLFVRLDSTPSAHGARTTARTAERTSERTARVRAHQERAHAALVSQLERAITRLEGDVAWLRQQLEAATTEREAAAVERAELRRLLAAGVPALPAATRAERREKRPVATPLARRLSRAWRVLWRG